MRDPKLLEMLESIIHSHYFPHIAGHDKSLPCAEKVYDAIQEWHKEQVKGLVEALEKSPHAFGCSEIIENQRCDCHKQALEKVRDGF